MHQLRSIKGGLLWRVLVGKILSMEPVLRTVCLNSTFTARPLSIDAGGNRQDRDGDGDDAEKQSSFAPKRGDAEYGKVQEKGENVAEEMEKKWKVKQDENEDELITFKDIGSDISRVSHPAGDE